jgi:single-strand DNA-binding protein
MVNKVMILGFLGVDPELKHTSQGLAIAMLRVATSRRWLDKDGERQEETDWHDVEVWGRQAEAAGEHLAKGRQVYVEGRLRTDAWTDRQSAQKRYRTKIVAEQVTFLGSKPASSPTHDASQREVQPAA